MLEPRPYQREAFAAFISTLRDTDESPCVVLPTGTGKSIVIAMIAAYVTGKLSRRVLILASKKELVEQNAGELFEAAPELPVGIYSAGLGQRDTETPILVAGIQSVYSKARQIGPFDLVVVDEAHEIPPDGEGMYRTLLADLLEQNPGLRIGGMTATPFRLGGGRICKPGNMLTSECYEASIRDMIADGYLSPLTSRSGARHGDFSGVHLQGGEFRADEVAAIMEDDELVRSACAETVKLCAERKAVLVFCASVAHAEKVRDELHRLTGEEIGLVTGETPTAERDMLIARIRGEKHPVDLLSDADLRWLVNVNVLTTGFNAPRIDAVVLMRATMSPVLYVQMVGRGTRLAPGKADCLVLDYGNNIVRHGPVDAVDVAEKANKDGKGEAPGKECPECHGVVHCAVMVCPDCGHEWEKALANHDPLAADIGIMSGEVTDTEYEVTGVRYQEWEKRNAPDAPRTLMVEYQVGFAASVREWVCPEHLGWARAKFASWWRERCASVPPPETAAEAQFYAQDGALAAPVSIVVRETAGEKFPRVIAYSLGDLPEYFAEPGEDHLEALALPPGFSYIDPTDEIPF